MTVYGLQKVYFNPYKSEKHFCLNDIDLNAMSRLTENQSIHAIGMLQSELAHNRVARYCGVHQNTIQSLLMRSVMVWGDIAKRDKTLLVVAGYLTGTRYRGEIAQLYVILFIQAQGNNVTFQQDNAGPHVARV